MAYSENTSLIKSFAILELLNSVDRGLGAVTVARMTGFPIPTTHRFLKNLTKLGYLTWDETHKTYSIGFALTLFGNRRTVINRIVKRSRPLLRELCRSTGLTAYIGSLEGPYAVVEARALPGRDQQSALLVGARLDAHAHSLGKALMALVAEKEVRSVYESAPLRRRTTRTIMCKDRLVCELNEVRRNGYAFDDEEFSSGVRSIGCALINPAGRALCSIALEGSKYVVEREKMRWLVSSLFMLRDEVMKPTNRAQKVDSSRLGTD